MRFLLPSSSRIGFLLAAACLAAPACTEAASEPSQQVMDGGRDAGTDGGDAADGGERVVTDATVSVVLTVGGDGLRAAEPEGSTCSGGSEYRYALATRAFEWDVCSDLGTFGDPWHVVSGARALSEGEHARVMTALREVVLATSPAICGADKPTVTLAVKTQGGEQLYTDSFYACRGGAAPYVDHIDVPLEVLAMLARDGFSNCLALPTCEPGRTAYASRQACFGDAFTCTEVSMCGATIWCGLSPADCDHAQEVYDAFLDAHDACAVDADCAIIGDCGPNADFAAIRADAKDEGRALQLARCGGAFDGPTYEPYCNAGTCAKREQPPSTEYGCPPLWDGDAGTE